MDTTRFRAHPSSPTGLFWNERGLITCRRHGPSPQSDSWRWERWEPMPVESAEAWRTEYGELPKCECCGLAAETEPF